VIDVLMRHGITFDGAAGISAGAVFGCNFKSGQVGRPIRYNKKYCADPRYCSVRSLINTPPHTRDFSHELAAFLFKTSCIKSYSII
jgi:predicted patatin/cPLA2 family phospholipase